MNFNFSAHPGRQRTPKLRRRADRLQIFLQQIRLLKWRKYWMLFLILLLRSEFGPRGRAVSAHKVRALFTNAQRFLPVGWLFPEIRWNFCLRPICVLNLQFCYILIVCRALRARHWLRFRPVGADRGSLPFWPRLPRLSLAPSSSLTFFLIPRFSNIFFTIIFGVSFVFQNFAFITCATASSSTALTSAKMDAVPEVKLVGKTGANLQVIHSFSKKALQ